MPASATQAGAQLLCLCGQEVDVPRLSDLRQAAGAQAYETSIIEVISRMARENALPITDQCAVCLQPTKDYVELHVQCESQWIQHSGAGRRLFALLATLVLPFWFLWWLIADSLMREKHVERGHDRSVRVQLPACDLHQATLRQMRSQAKLKKLLRTVPLYAELLSEFPRAKVAPCSRTISSELVTPRCV